jgi:hypothetical protein
MSSRSALIRLLALVFAFFLVTGLLYASTTTSNLSWWVIGSGGNRLSSGNVVLQSTLGQPLAYRASNGNLALCAGFWCATGGDYEVFLPVVMKQFCGGFAGPSELEDNDHWSRANGPICSGRIYSGTLTPGDYDWFSLEKPAGGRISIAETGQLEGSGLTLFYEGTPLQQVHHVGEAPYSYECTEKCSAGGRYYIRLVSGSAVAVPYTLQVTFP